MARVRNSLTGRYMGNGGRSGFVIHSDTLTPGLVTFPFKLDTALRGVMEYHEPRVESFMRTNAPWTDRTTNARNGLNAKAISGDGKYAIVCFHTMPYGPWLELSNNGKYRIIVPTIVHEGREVMKTVRGLFRRMG